MWTHRTLLLNAWKGRTVSLTAHPFSVFCCTRGGARRADVIRTVVSVVIEPLELESLREKQLVKIYSVNTEPRAKIKSVFTVVGFGSKEQFSSQVSEVFHFSGFNSRRGQLPGLSGETERTEMVFVFFFFLYIVSYVSIFSFFSLLSGFIHGALLCL